MSYLSESTCLPTPPRPNTDILFQLVDASKPQLSLSPSLFITEAWSQLLRLYPEQNLCIHLVMLLRFGCLLGYTGPEAWILSRNLPSALIDQPVIDKKLAEDLSTERVVGVNPNFPFISSLLGLVSKHDGGFRRIHHLSYPRGDLIPRCKESLPRSSLPVDTQC